MNGHDLRGELRQVHGGEAAVAAQGIFDARCSVVAATISSSSQLTTRSIMRALPACGSSARYRSCRAVRA